VLDNSTAALLLKSDALYLVDDINLIDISAVDCRPVLYSQRLSRIFVRAITFLLAYTIISTVLTADYACI